MSVNVTVEVDCCGRCPYCHTPTWGMCDECTAYEKDENRKPDGKWPPGYISDETKIPDWCPFLE